MSTIVKEVVIPSNHRMNLDIEVPADVPPGEAVVTVTIKTKTTEGRRKNRLGELYGLGKGEIWVSDDFDAPLEDFKEYM